MEHALFIKSMAMLERYHGKVLDDDIKEMYWRSLKDLSDDKFKMAMVKCMTEYVSTSQRPFPLISEILALCGESMDTKAINAISIIKLAAEKYGQYKSVDFGDPALHSVIRRYGGWPDVVTWGEKDWQFHERNFIAAYKAAQTLVYGKCGYLEGLIEIENKQGGFKYDPPVKIARTEKLKKIEHLVT